jgi:hypothetical protein
MKLILSPHFQRFRGLLFELPANPSLQTIKELMLLSGCKSRNIFFISYK